MNKQFKLLLYAGILIAMMAGPASAQLYTVPKKVSLDALVRRTFPDYFGRHQRYPQLITEQFFPIGWSRDGKFAYYVEPVDEACGCYYANLVIQDLRTDKVLWEFKYDQGREMDDAGKMPPEDNIRKLWRKNGKLFSDKLRENGIVASDFAMLGKTFAIGGKSYTTKVATPRGKDADGEPRIINISLTLSSPKLGTKTLYKEDFSSEQYTFTLDAGVVGAFKSPYENRVALLMIEVNRGYEGPPHTADVRIVGADLVGGFSRK